jgi:hypothetical protein
MRICEASIWRMRESLLSFCNALEVTSIHMLSPFFLPPSRLLSILYNIKDKLLDNITLITPLNLNETYLYYSLATVQAASYRDSIRLFIELPLKQPNRHYTLYRALEFPSLVSDNGLTVYVKPDTRYFAMCKDRLLHMLVHSESDLNCSGDTIKVCPPNLPVYTMVPACIVYLLALRRVLRFIVGSIL